MSQVLTWPQRPGQSSTPSSGPVFRHTARMRFARRPRTHFGGGGESLVTGRAVRLRRAPKGGPSGLRRYIQCTPGSTPCLGRRKVRSRRRVPDLNISVGIPGRCIFPPGWHSKCFMDRRPSVHFGPSHAGRAFGFGRKHVHFVSASPKRAANAASRGLAVRRSAASQARSPFVRACRLARLQGNL